MSNLQPFFFFTRILTALRSYCLFPKELLPFSDFEHPPHRWGDLGSLTWSYGKPWCPAGVSNPQPGYAVCGTDVQRGQRWTPDTNQSCSLFQVLPPLKEKKWVSLMKKTRTSVWWRRKAVVWLVGSPKILLAYLGLFPPGLSLKGRTKNTWKDGLKNSYFCALFSFCKLTLLSR